MSSRANTTSGGAKVRKVMTQAINLLFEFLKNRERVQIWLYENTNMKMEGVIIGFDEYMNVVLDDAEEVFVRKQERRPVGRVMLKGDCISLIHRASSAVSGDGNSGSSASGASGMDEEED